MNTRAAINGFFAALLCFAWLEICQAQEASKPTPIIEQKKNSNDSPTLQLKTRLVTLNVNVTDRAGTPITGLHPQRFEVYEDGVRQSVEFFNTTDSPASIGVIFDRSSSMQRLLPRAHQAFAEFVQTSHSEDEYFLITFDKTPQLILAQANGENLMQKLTQERAEGDTSLHDAVALGLQQLRQAKYPKRALLIFSDGVDTSSRTSYSTLLNAVKEADCQIFFVGSNDIQSAGCGRLCQMQTFNRMHDLANVTGGQAFFLLNPQAIESTITQIALLLRQQYSLGYLPSNESRNRKWRKIDVKVSTPEAKSRVFARKGYYDRLEAEVE